MKTVIAIIQPTKLKAVHEALRKIEVTRMTITDALGYGRQRGQREVYRGAEYTVDFVPKVRLEVLVEDLDASSVVDVIVKAATTGRIGDGKVWIVPVEDVAALADCAADAIARRGTLGPLLARARATAEANSYDAQRPLWRAFLQGFVDRKDPA